MNKVNWTVVILVGVVVLLLLTLGGGLLGGMMGYGGYPYGGWGMMVPWMLGGMFFMWLVPLALIGLLVLAVIWAVNALGGGSGRGASSRTCPNCGKSVQTDWKNCPYCGTLLSN